MKTSNWPGGIDYGHSNFTLKFPRQARGGYAPGSESPKCGWPLAFAIGIAVCALFLFGPTLAARIIGL